VSDLAPQLPLGLSLPDDATLENFLAFDSTRGLCDLIGAAPQEPLLFLQGPAAVGKTHLLQAACHAVTASLYLPLGDLRELSPASLLTDLEAQQRLSLDQVEAVSGDAAWEEAIFHLVNRCRASGCQLLFASRRPPSDCGVVLPDLASRLAGGVTWALPAPDDEQLRQILAFRARRRGLRLPAAVLDYISTRAQRSLPELLELLERLDRASLQAQRPITIPLVRSVTGW
jgi:DnaA family protein